MPPPHQPDEPGQLDRWLRRTHTITTWGRNTCGIGWLLFLCWIMWIRPDTLGPSRMIGGLALASITATCTVLWWMARVKMLERLERTIAGIDAAVPTAGPNGARPAAVRPLR